MNIETTARLLKAFQSCPGCGEDMMLDKLKVDFNNFQLKCKCGWKLTVKESGSF